MEWEPCRETDKLNEFMAAFSILWLTVLVLACIASLCGLFGCTGAGAVVGPSGEPAAVVGMWAASMPAQGDTVLITLNISQSKAYSSEITAAGAVIDIESGTWTIGGNHWITMANSCNQADSLGGKLRPVTCTGPDSTIINISGNSWDVDFPSSGQLLHLHLVRI